MKYIITKLNISKQSIEWRSERQVNRVEKRREKHKGAGNYGALQLSLTTKIFILEN